MKASTAAVAPEPPKFNRFSLVLTIESQSEAQALYAMFNHNWTLDAFEAVSGSREPAEEIRRALRSQCDGTVANGFARYHEVLTSAVRK